MSGAVKKLQDLDRALAADADRIAILRSLNRTVIFCERGDQRRELVNAVAIVEKIMHDLVQGTLGYLFAQHPAHVLLGLIDRAGEITNPRWIEPSGCNQRPEFGREGAFPFQ